MIESLPLGNAEKRALLAQLTYELLAEKTTQGPGCLPFIADGHDRTQDWSMYGGTSCVYGNKYHVGILKVGDRSPQYLLGFYPITGNLDTPTNRTLIWLSNDTISHLSNGGPDMGFRHWGDALSTIADFDSTIDEQAGRFAALDMIYTAEQSDMLKS